MPANENILQKFDTDSIQSLSFGDSVLPPLLTWSSGNTPITESFHHTKSTVVNAKNIVHTLENVFMQQLAKEEKAAVESRR